MIFLNEIKYMRIFTLEVSLKTNYPANIFSSFHNRSPYYDATETFWLMVEV